MASPPSTMRALQHTQSTGHLKLVNIAIPTATPETCLIKVTAVAITSGELTWTRPKDLDVSIPGVEFAGVVVKSLAEEYKPGAKVFMRVRFPNPGAAAEYIVAHKHGMTIRPTNLTAVQAASVPVSALTAWQGIYERAGIIHPFDPRRAERMTREGSHRRILINGGATAVGLWYLQLLRNIADGSITIVATASTAKVGWLKHFRAHEIIDYKTSSIEAQYDLMPYDYIFDCVGGDHGDLNELWAALAPGGRIITIVPFESMQNYDNQYLPTPSEVQDLGVSAQFFVMKPNSTQLDEIANLIKIGDVEAVVDSVFDLEDYEKAFERLQSGQQVGKVVLKVCDEEC